MRIGVALFAALSLITIAATGCSVAALDQPPSPDAAPSAAFGPVPTSDAGTHPSGEAGPPRGGYEGVEPTADAGVTPGADSGVEAGADPSADAAAGPAVDAGVAPDADAGVPALPAFSCTTTTTEHSNCYWGGQTYSDVKNSTACKDNIFPEDCKDGYSSRVYDGCNFWTADTRTSHPGTCADAQAMTDKVGKECSTDADCGASMICLTPATNIWSGESAPRGYCSRACDPSAPAASADDVCGGAATCVVGESGDLEGWCMRSCTSICTPEREACVGLIKDDGSPAGSACLPRCLADSDCAGAGRVCDPRSGMCGDATRVSHGTPTGTRCTPGPNEGGCAGYCVTDTGGKGVCGQACVVGAASNGGCQSDALCAPTDTANLSGSSGWCVHRCGADADCLDGERCLQTARGNACL
jgi:hypothetical protein